MSQLCVTPQSQFLFHPVMRAPASLEFAGMPWMSEHLQHHERYTDFPGSRHLGMSCRTNGILCLNRMTAYTIRSMSLKPCAVRNGMHFP